MITMGLSALSILMTLVVLNLHHKSVEKTISSTGRNILFGYIAPAIGMKDTGKKYAEVNQPSGKSHKSVTGSKVKIVPFEEIVEDIKGNFKVKLIT